MNAIPYNRNAAIEYARTWAFSRNPYYYDFSDIGGDCTNFVSQALVAGGMPMNFANPMGWYYRNLDDRAAAFTGVKYLYNFLTRQNVSTGPFATEVPIYKAEPGDIIQLSFDGENWAHSLLIVAQNPNNPTDPFTATHSEDSFGRLLSSYPFKRKRVLHILGGYY
ncbi:MAG: amidase domain-containing protein [Firmicutes bacterium]|nr:amidase domain-containing protein [Bacillota bacterium]